MAANCVVIAPSVRTTFRPTRRRRCFVAFEAIPDDPGLARGWHHIKTYETQEHAVADLAAPGRKVYLAKGLPQIGGDERLAVKAV